MGIKIETIAVDTSEHDEHLTTGGDPRSAPGFAVTAEFKPPVSVEVVVEGGALERVESDLVRLSTHAKRRAEASERHPDWPRGSQAAKRKVP